MADEADIIEVGKISYYTTATLTEIKKGTFVILSDPRTVAAHAAVNELCAGVTVADKPDDNALTNARVGVMETGKIDMVADGNITVGDVLVLSAVANRCKTMPATLSANSLRYIVGRALETATDGERINVDLRI